MGDGAERSGESGGRVLEHATPGGRVRGLHSDRYVVWTARILVLFLWTLIINPHDYASIEPSMIVATLAIALGLAWRGGWIDSSARWIYLFLACGQFASSGSWWLHVRY